MNEGFSAWFFLLIILKSQSCVLYIWSCERLSYKKDSSCYKGAALSGQFLDPISSKNIVWKPVLAAKWIINLERESPRRTKLITFYSGANNISRDWIHGTFISSLVNCK